MTKHTPGPWEVVDDASGVYIRTTRGGGFDEVFEVYIAPASKPEQREADIDLIAAAPDLYAVLESVEWGGSPFEPVCPYCGAHRDDDGGHVKDCRLAAALARARGEEVPL